MRGGDDGERRRARAPRRRSCLAKLLVLIGVLAAGAGAYLVWRYHRETGRVDLDGESWREVVSEEVEGVKEGLRKTKDVIGDASRRTIADARGLLASLDEWLKTRQSGPASREELEDTREAYAREFREEPPPAAARPEGGPAAAGPEDDPPSAAASSEDEPPSGAPPPAPSPAPRAATGEAAELLESGREEFRVGLEHWRAAGEPGSPREQEELAVARERFTAAQDILTRAQELAPEAPEIEKLLVDTNRFLYDCLKRLKVDVRG